MAGDLQDEIVLALWAFDRFGNALVEVLAEHVDRVGITYLRHRRDTVRPFPRHGRSSHSLASANHIATTCGLTALGQYSRSPAMGNA